jgi:peptide/nickel transport system substrate-binding protein
MAQLGDAARYYRYDPAEAKRLLAEVGYPNGFPATIDFTTYGSGTLVDSVQLILKDLKDVGIEARLNQRNTARTPRPRCTASTNRWPMAR